MMIVDTHKLCSFLIVRYGAESPPQFGVVQQQLQPADNSKSDNEHQAGEDPHRQASRQVDAQCFQITDLQSPAVSAEDLEQGVLKNNAYTERDEDRRQDLAA
jgi:hypothetical protein